jgi:DNA polymerase III sliding clamp (beta) subunit (PCNA family)
MQGKIPAVHLKRLVKKGSIALKCATKAPAGYGEYGLITVKNNSIGIHASSELAGSCFSIEAEEGFEIASEGACCASLVVFSKMLSFVPDSEVVSFKYKPTDEGVHAGKLEFKTKKSKWTLPCKAEEFLSEVTVPTHFPASFEIDKRDLINNASKALFAGNVFDADEVFNNVMLQTQGKENIYIVSTDGIRCAIANSDISEFSAKASFLVQIKTLPVLLGVFGDGPLSIHIDDKMAYIVQGTHIVRTLVSDKDKKSVFPDFTGILKADTRGSISVSRERLKDLFEASKAVNSDEALMTVRGGELTVRTYSQEDDVSFNSSVAYVGEEVDFSMGVRPGFVSDYLRHCDNETIDLTFSEMDQRENWPAFIKFSDADSSVYFLRTLASFVHLNIPDSE